MSEDEDTNDGTWLDTKIVDGRIAVHGLIDLMIGRHRFEVQEIQCGDVYLKRAYPGSTAWSIRLWHDHGSGGIIYDWDDTRRQWTDITRLETYEQGDYGMGDLMAIVDRAVSAPKP